MALVGQQCHNRGSVPRVLALYCVLSARQEGLPQCPVCHLSPDGCGIRRRAEQVAVQMAWRRMGRLHRNGLLSRTQCTSFQKKCHSVVLVGKGKGEACGCNGNRTGKQPHCRLLDKRLSAGIERTMVQHGGGMAQRKALACLRTLSFGCECGRLPPVPCRSPHALPKGFAPNVQITLRTDKQRLLR